MRADNLSALDGKSLEEVEITLDLHTREQVPVTRYTEFSWSATRHATFERCRREYYLRYYGSRRVREANDPIVSAVWWLKQVTTLRTWIGSVIHVAASRAVEALRDEVELTRQEVIDIALETYRRGVEASRRGAKVDDKWVVLFEHIYPEARPSIDPAEAEERVAELANVLYDSEAYQWLRGVEPNMIVEIDPAFQSFMLNDVEGLGELRVFAIPDVLLHEPGYALVRIIDWKTGSVKSESHREQAGVYILYAHRAYGVPDESIEFVLADLGGGGRNVQLPGGPVTVVEAEALTRKSVYNMLAALENIRFNTARIRDFPMTEDRSLCRWCGFRRACGRDD
ncbi:MAG TPA: PD-(D/E)XK nuclease family protein [Aggregatilineales bacterium]|nr:PD-(D/E)XK nuclease family protein [Chloroflexota bacterium]HOA22423.1 PD-(D/E)XK nuclease family protein [Aggregatilineales bacterium]HPV06458.1 PD-(D/E)XK nuclease family protein [Aggregatilineales bacterium]HQA67433.1 PD-(D/E)XK nuclease family protein [Aggregatilineales bacterium]HQE19683.1 PD-(D/E)XK nuclease family protein [Aggregatilineales bacterium]